MTRFIQRISKLARDPLRFADAADQLPHEIYDPVSESVVADVEQALGFPFPSLLRRLYTEVENGGFGPGGGIFGLEIGPIGLEDAHRDDNFLCLPELYFGFREGVIEDESNWPEKVLPVWTIGCAMYDGIDCGLPDFPVLQMTGGSEPLTKTGIHFRDCTDTWATRMEAKQ